MNPVIDKIYWENNSRVKSSSLINPAKIVPKSSTDQFPMDAITIRLRDINSQNLNGTAYFYGKAETHKDWQGNPYQVAGSKLMVSVVNGKSHIVFNGGVCNKSYSMQDLTDAINYCKEVISKL